MRLFRELREGECGDQVGLERAAGGQLENQLADGAEEHGRAVDLDQRHGLFLVFREERRIGREETANLYLEGIGAFFIGRISPFADAKMDDKIGLGLPGRELDAGLERKHLVLADLANLRLDLYLREEVVNQAQRRCLHGQPPFPLPEHGTAS